MSKSVVRIFFVLASILIIGGAYLVFIKDDEKGAFLKLEKIVLKEEEKKVLVNKKEVSLKLDNELYINGNKLDVEIITNIYNTGDYLIISYKGNANDKYMFINEEGNIIEITYNGVSSDNEYSNLRLDTNKLIADTNDDIVEITYKDNKINIKKR